MIEKYKLIIVGGGGAGFAAATVASEAGARVALLNAGLPLGGTCVNVGCVPSKLLLEIGSDYYHALHPRFRATRNGGQVPFDFSAAIGDKDETVGMLRQSNYTRVAEGLGTTVIEGQARFISPTQIEVDGQALEAEKFIIATGSRPRILPFKGIDKVHYLTNREALSLRRLPASMTIVGAGPLGMEFAQMYARFGTRVTVLAKEDQVLRHEEPEVADELQRCLEAEGITIHTGVDVEAVREEGNLKVVEARLGDRRITVQGDELLLATGVVPNTGDLGLEAAGVETDHSGLVVVNNELRTSAGNIWAAGDVIGGLFLETVAAKEGFVAASNALNGTSKTIDYNSIPRAVFTDPQVASVGSTEEEFMREHGICACRTVRLEQLPKARAVKETRGLVKMAIHPDTQAVAGVHIVAPIAAELIHEATLAVKFKLTLADIIDTVHVFPTFSEAIKLVAQSFTRDISQMSCCVE